ncbi:hypothetical protein [Subtercola vilae]|uniref:Uncharacterized protein n=1 Tax=Subtercola vilae TaxID=2056433 RepID=A0A4T2B7Z8_9MICO|nr:hypothetical protein [Subtercola vilae]TIH27075.1 hypothetical protein D4765_18615 [Subtercola vilae]
MSNSKGFGLGFAVVSFAVIVFAAPPVAAFASSTAHASNAQGNLSVLAQPQQVSLATDGLYAPTMESLTSDDFGQAARPGVGAVLSYVVNASRTHYVSAAKLDDQVMVSSDEHLGEVTCGSYNAECLAQVTSDSDLVAAPAQWINF